MGTELVPETLYSNELTRLCAREDYIESCRRESLKDKKATGDDDVPGDVLKLLGEDGLKLITQLINSIYITGDWPRDLIEVIMIALKKKPKATKHNDHRTISIIAHAA
jgi:hypothetical protein